MNKLLFLACCLLISSSSIWAQCAVSFSTQQSPADPTAVWFAPAVTLDGNFVNAYSLLWDFGDGNTDSSNFPMNDYATAGFYVACVTAVLPDGCMATFCDSLVVGTMVGAICNAQFLVAPFEPGATNYFYFSSTSISSEPIGTYWWDFGDGTMSNDAELSHLFDADGVYDVCLTIMSGIPGTASFCTDQQCNAIIVGDPTAYDVCTASFYQSSDTLNPMTISFTNMSGGLLGDATSLYWDFGDGSTSNEWNPVHTYDTPGDSTGYTACLIATFGNDPATVCIDTFCSPIYFMVTINLDYCFAQFAHVPSVTDPAGHPYNFIDASFSTGDINSWLWTFGDGTSSTEQNPYHIFYADTLYQVCLTIFSTLPDGSICEQMTCSMVDSDPSSPAGEFGSICGSVVASDVNCICPMSEPMTVYLIQYDPEPGVLTAIDSILLDNTQQVFCFDSLPTANNYLIKAALSPESSVYYNYLPTYYEASPTWSGATMVNSNMSSLLWLSMQAGAYPGGTGFIGGNVSDGAGKTEASWVNVTVLLLDENGTALASTYTDDAGNYSFPNLAYGTYQILVDIAGLTATPQTVTITEYTPSVDAINFEVLSTQIEIANSSISELLIEPFNIVALPSIVTSQGNLQLNCPIAYNQLLITIYNSAGIPVWSRTDNFGQGTHSVRFGAYRWARGLYTAVVTTDGQPLGYVKFLKQ